MSEDKRKGTQLPYNFDIILFDKMLNEIKNTLVHLRGFQPFEMTVTFEG